jgi:hypothetical protein
MASALPPAFNMAHTDPRFRALTREQQARLEYVFEDTTVCPRESLTDRSLFESKTIADVALRIHGAR